MFIIIMCYTRPSYDWEYELKQASTMLLCLNILPAAVVGSVEVPSNVYLL